MRVARNTSGLWAEGDDMLARHLEQSAHPLGRLVQRAWAAYWRWQLRRATVQLLSLDDHLLRDLGISRDEIHLYVHGRPPYGSSASREDRS